jgi:hypothetical protein
MAKSIMLVARVCGRGTELDRQKIEKMVAKQGGCVARRLIMIWPSEHF